MAVTSNGAAMRRPLRIGIDGCILDQQRRGVARYIWELCRGLDHALPQARFFLYGCRSRCLIAPSPRWTLRGDTSVAGRRVPISVWLTVRVGSMTRRDNLDVFWGPTGLLPLMGLRARAIVTVHDLVYQIAPDTMRRKARWVMRTLLGPSLARADSILVNSAGTAARLQAWMGYKAVGVVRPGLSAIFRPRSESEVEAALTRYGIARPYLLAVATWEPRKGLELLMHCFARMKSQGLLMETKLVLVGARGWKDERIAAAANRYRRDVAYLGFVDDESLSALYSAAQAFVYPSRYEGFGMPVLEARACGARVVTTDIPELREAGGEGATYVAATEQGLTQGILEALSATAAEPLNWVDFSWSKSAQRLAQFIADTA